MSSFLFERLWGFSPPSGGRKAHPYMGCRTAMKNPARAHAMPLLGLVEEAIWLRPQDCLGNKYKKRAIPIDHRLC